MAAGRDRAAQAAEAAWAIKDSPAVQRYLQDADLRNNIREAVDLSRSAYGRLNNGKPPTKALMEDKKLQRELQNAAELFRDSALSLKEGPVRKRKKHRLRKLLLVGIVGFVAALVLSEGLRKQVLDALFGAEEEFDYTSTTTPAPAASPAAASASS